MRLLAVWLLLAVLACPARVLAADGGGPSVFSPGCKPSEAMTEFHRLSDIFELFVEFERSRMTPEEVVEDRNDVRSREQSLKMVEDGKFTICHVAGGARDAVNDISEMLGFGAEEGDPFTAQFLVYYRQQTGRDYYEDAGSPYEMARAILKRGRIADETEYRLIIAILSNANQKTFTSAEIDSVNGLMSQFDASSARQ